MVISQPVQFGCCCLLICIIVYFFLSFSSSSPSSFYRPPRRPILIFAATKFFSSRVTSDKFLTACTSSIDWCSISDNITDISRADAIVFHNRNFNVNHTIRFRERTTDIPYVLWGRESPSNDNFRKEEDFINWTMTYRRDADIWYPYGRMERRKNSTTIDFERIWTGKNQSLPPATWLSSNCRTANSREKIVARMEQQGLKVDKWGRCGRPPPHCGSMHNYWDNCTVQLIKTREAVPIVLNRRIYEDLGLLSSAFIALSDYSSIAEAVREINRIANDKEAYLEYHKWRDEYEIIREDNDETGFCALCKKLAERSHFSPMERLESRKSYKSVQSWHADGICDNSIKFV